MNQNTCKTAKAGINKNVDVEKTIGYEPAAKNKPVTNGKILNWFEDEAMTQNKNWTYQKQA